MSTTAESGINLDLSDEQRAIQETVRQFVDERVLPVARRERHRAPARHGHHRGHGRARHPRRADPRGVRRRGPRLRLRGAHLRGDRARRGGVPHAHLACTSGSTRCRCSSTAPRSRSSAGWCRRRSGEKLACFGLTEPAAGSDVAAMLTHGDAARATSTCSTARRTGSRTPRSPTTRSCFAKTDPRRGHKRHHGVRGRAKDTPGVRTQDIPNKLGIWAGSTGELFFEDVEVPAENLIGEEGAGLQDRDVLARPGPLHGRRRRGRRDPRLPRAVDEVRATSARRSASRSASTSSCRT